jgi:hypothetical protein
MSVSVVWLITRLPWAIDTQVLRDAGLSMIEYTTMAMLSAPGRTLRLSDLVAGDAAGFRRLGPPLAGLCRMRSDRRTDRGGRPPMTEPNDPPRPRDYALQEELDSLHEQEREGHSTPKEQRRAEQLEHRLRADEHEAEAQEREARPRHETNEERARRRR